MRGASPLYKRKKLNPEDESRFPRVPGPDDTSSEKWVVRTGLEESALLFRVPSEAWPAGEGRLGNASQLESQDLGASPNSMMQARWGRSGVAGERVVCSTVLPHCWAGGSMAPLPTPPPI